MHRASALPSNPTPRTSGRSRSLALDHLPLLVHGKSQFERLKTLPGFAVVVGLKRVGDDHQLLYDWLICGHDAALGPICEVGFSYCFASHESLIPLTGGEVEETT